ncbi:hypothetical protein DRW03_20950 [Corallococcus sp. H22C18031201]|uniref:hypothetical protein n=1 Tax=Citreicoccus inhibens TaxID=2849499 RepID=UPI000E70F6CD|nr:hypothetical protein [Citreicoccus inhibens]MBU8895805.1 hypothetical protein [Citreicoccus inhibens]RJS20218.1 hypothetical protein DRW03_20950 [Corallococcus sp. H22C18031201]
MKRKISVVAGVMAAVVAVSARAEEASAAPAAEQGVSAPAEFPVAQAPLSPAPLVDATTGAGTVAAPSAAPAVATSAQATPDEVYVPISLTLLPNISTAGMHTGNVVTNYSLGLLATHAKRVNGLATSLGANWVEAGLSGVQMTVGANVSRGPVSGAQFAVGANVATQDLVGIQQSAGINVVRGGMEGAQFGVGANITGGLMNGAQFSAGANVASAGGVGAQLGVGANIAGATFRGLQATAGLNVAQEMTGLQMSSGVSSARKLDGAQLSIINVGGDIDGAQVGIVNVGGRVDGLQLGVINVARESEGESVGLMSFVGNGQGNLQLWGGDLAAMNAAVKFGGKHLYTLLTVGFNPGSDTRRRRYLLGAAFGAHIPMERFFIDMDVMGSSVHDDRLFKDGDGENILGQLRLVGGWQVARRFALIGGITGNTLVTMHGSDRWEELGIGPEWKNVSDNGRTTVRVWPGFLLGVQI